MPREPVALAGPCFRVAVAALVWVLGATNAKAEEQRQPLDEALENIGIPAATVYADGSARLEYFLNSGTLFGGGTVYGAENQLAFKVDPIVLAGITAGVRFPDRRGWEKVGLKAAYETNRMYQSGGTVRQEGLAEALDVPSEAADIFNGLVAVAGVSAEVEYATFTNGRVQIQDVATGTPFDDAPLVFTRVRVQGAVDLARYLTSSEKRDQQVPPPERRSRWGGTFTYYQLTLPRIVYMTREQEAPDGESAPIQVVAVETPPQDITMNLVALGPSGRLTVTKGRYGYLAGEVAVEIGGGWFTYYLPANLNEPPSSDNRVYRTDAGLGLVGRAAVDGEFVLVDDDFDFYVRGATIWNQYYAETQVAGEYGGGVAFADSFFSAIAFFGGRYDVTQ